MFDVCGAPSEGFCRQCHLFDKINDIVYNVEHVTKWLIYLSQVKSNF